VRSRGLIVAIVVLVFTVVRVLIASQFVFIQLIIAIMVEPRE
jgi:hypothetical protein